jgi:hypothetical protein
MTSVPAERGEARPQELLLLKKGGNLGSLVRDCDLISDEVRK